MLLLDALVWPIMWLISICSGASITAGTQRTHRWNNQKLQPSDVHWNASATVHNSGDPRANDRGIVRFHIPFLGGWKRYVVIGPTDQEIVWHIGWHAPDVTGVSLVPVKGPVRVLIGNSHVVHFGLSHESKTQIPVHQIGSGHIGDGQTLERLPLF